MTHEGDDFAVWSQEFDATGDRAELLERVRQLRTDVALPLDLSLREKDAISRRFIVLSGPNAAVPTETERMLLIPKDDKRPVHGIEQLAVYQPLLVEKDPGDELVGRQQSDSQFVFFEARGEGRPLWRAFLSTEQLSPYGDSGDIVRVQEGSDDFYRVVHSYEVAETISTKLAFGDYRDPAQDFSALGVETEEEAISLLRELLEAYEPQIIGKEESSSF